MANTVNETKYIKIQDCYYYSIPNGRSFYRMNCPFCNFPIMVYAWSASSVGKKCPNCKAKVIFDYGTGKFEVCKTKKERKNKNEIK